MTTITVSGWRLVYVMAACLLFGAGAALVFGATAMPLGSDGRNSLTSMGIVALFLCVGVATFGTIITRVRRRPPRVP